MMDRSKHEAPLEDESTLGRSRARLRPLVEQAGLSDTEVAVLAKPLTPEEAIGTPGRRDFPILIGKERVIEAELADAKGHAFTDAPSEFVGTLRQVLDMELDSNARRALFVATLNAAMRHLGLAEGTVHCRDDDPEQCAQIIADRIVEGGVPPESTGGSAPRESAPKVGLIGLNPAMAERLVTVFGAGRVLIADRNPDNLGKPKFGVVVWDGAERWQDLVDEAAVVLMTGTTLVNDTFDPIWHHIQATGKRGIVYGVTGAGIATLLGFERLCPCGR